MSLKPFKPLLAATLKQEEIDSLPYPMLLSAKLDGIRAVIIDGTVFSRNLKPIPNAYVQELFGKEEYNGFDGELIVGPSWAKDVYNRTVSGVMSEDGEPDVRYHVFDNIEDRFANTEYASRLHVIQLRIEPLDDESRVYIVPQNRIEDEEQLLSYEKALVGQGYEGVMIRSLEGKYKRGRATNRECNIFKLKRFADSEAEILDFEEQYENQNIKQINELGNSFRSSHKDGMVAQDTLGALVVRDIHTGVEFNIGSGYDDEQREWFWANRPTLKGKIVKYKHFPIGVKDKPRFPIYLGFRDPIDL